MPWLGRGCCSGFITRCRMQILIVCVCACALSHSVCGPTLTISCFFLFLPAVSSDLNEPALWFGLKSCWEEGWGGGRGSQKVPDTHTLLQAEVPMGTGGGQNVVSGLCRSWNPLKGVPRVAPLRRWKKAHEVDLGDGILKNPFVCIFLHFIFIFYSDSSVCNGDWLSLLYYTHLLFFFCSNLYPFSSS